MRRLVLSVGLVGPGSSVAAWPASESRRPVVSSNHMEDRLARRRWLVLALGCLVAAGGTRCNEETVTAPTLAAECAATPSSGPAPLTVVFTLNVAGAQGAFAVAVDYGDGTRGEDAGQPHVYTAAGSYGTAFTVATATQSARCSVLVTVAAPAPAPPPPNQPPEPVFKTAPAAIGSTISGQAPFTVNFDMCNTGDPDKDVLHYKMDLDGDGRFEVNGSTGAQCRHRYTYAAGTYQPTVCVTDVDCSTWPSCEGTPERHPFQCRTYTVVASP